MLRFGYPKVHDGHNTLYSLWQPWRDAGIGIDEASDAYTGSPWLQYYVGALGVALGEGSADLYTRSALVRLPFALLGCAGLALALLDAAPGLRREPRAPARLRRALRAAAGELGDAAAPPARGASLRADGRRHGRRLPRAAATPRVRVASLRPVRRAAGGVARVAVPQLPPGRAGPRRERGAVADAARVAPPGRRARARAVARARGRSAGGRRARHAAAARLLRLLRADAALERALRRRGSPSAQRGLRADDAAAPGVARAGARAERGRLVAGASRRARSGRRADGSAPSLRRLPRARDRRLRAADVRHSLPVRALLRRARPADLAAAAARPGDARRSRTRRGAGGAARRAGRAGGGGRMLRRRAGAARAAAGRRASARSARPAAVRSTP